MQAIFRSWPYRRLLVLVSFVALVCAVVQPGVRTEAQDASPDAAVAEEAVAPAATLAAARGTIRTPQQVEAAEAALGPVPRAAVVKPFRPTMSDAEYKAAKAAAATSTPSSGGRPDVGAPAEPLGPPPLILTNINGVSQQGLIPPDTHGAVGASHFVEITNSHLDVYTKSTAPSLVRTQTLASFFGYTAQTIFDPRAVYDPIWKRWVIYAEAFPQSATDQRLLVAVSTTSSATGSFFIYNFDINIFNNDDFWDYGQVGFDQDAVIFTANIFGNAGLKGARLFAVAKARLYNGLGFSVPVFSGLFSTLAPPIVLDQNGRTFLVAAPPNSNTIRKYTLTNSSRPNLTALALSNITVPAYSVPRDAFQAAPCSTTTSQRLDTLDGRFLNASTQIGDRLFQVHTINFGGFPTPKFYEFNTTSNTVVQSGFFFAAGDSDDFNASIAANAARDVYVTWSATRRSTNTNAQVRFSGRRNFDPANVIAAGSSLFTSPTCITGNFDPRFGTQRWGDYSAVTVDPSNSFRAWLVNEKINSSSAWGSRIAQVGY